MLHYAVHYTTVVYDSFFESTQHTTYNRKSHCTAMHIIQQIVLTYCELVLGATYNRLLYSVCLLSLVGALLRHLPHQCPPRQFGLCQGVLDKIPEGQLV